MNPMSCLSLGDSKMFSTQLGPSRSSQSNGRVRQVSTRYAKAYLRENYRMLRTYIEYITQSVLGREDVGWGPKEEVIQERLP